MRKTLVCISSVLITSISFAQSGKGKASITILNEQKTPLEGATVELLRNKDSALVKTAIADKTGLAEIENIKPATYLFRINSVGSNATYTAAFDVKENETVTLSSISLASSSTNQMQGVTVAGRKSFLQRLNDRLIVNVDNSIVNVGSTAFEVLERSPGVTIDQNDVIALRGRQGVIIMIDSKPSPMTGADLVNYLRGLPVGAIDRIEIITNPSSKYDAAGNSGIIDIRMKKDQRLGYNGTITAGYGQDSFRMCIYAGLFSKRPFYVE
jgi:hypothetical protein